jgi:uncharacterized membrane protein YphA (DoxX/SURF4 family)
MLAGIFVASGARTFVNPGPATAAAAPVTDRVGPWLSSLDKRLPTDARTLVQINAATHFVGGLLLLTRLHRPAALALVASLVPTTLAGHRFWETDDPAQRTQFLKNAAIAGGLMLAATDTEGRPGLRWRTRHALTDANRSLAHEVRLAKARTRAGARRLS